MIDQPCAKPNGVTMDQSVLNSPLSTMIHTKIMAERGSIFEALLYKVVSLAPSSELAAICYPYHLQHHFCTERIDDYKCDKCGNKGIRKMLALETAPNYLLIVIKRYQLHPNMFGVGCLEGLGLGGLAGGIVVSVW